MRSNRVAEYSGDGGAGGTPRIGRRQVKRKGRIVAASDTVDEESCSAPCGAWGEMVRKVNGKRKFEPSSRDVMNGVEGFQSTKGQGFLGVRHPSPVVPYLAHPREGRLGNSGVFSRSSAHPPGLVGERVAGALRAGSRNAGCWEMRLASVARGPLFLSAGGERWKRTGCGAGSA